jgi:hypothetical protein
MSDKAASRDATHGGFALYFFTSPPLAVYTPRALPHGSAEAAAVLRRIAFEAYIPFAYSARLLVR